VLLGPARQAEAVTGAGHFALALAPVRVPVLFGGRANATVRRVATTGDGWAGGGFRDYDYQSSFADRVRAAWTDAGRPGTPRLAAGVNYTLGDARTLESAHAHMYGFYRYSPEFAELAVAAIKAMITSTADITTTVRTYRDLGFDEVVFHPAWRGSTNSTGSPTPPCDEPRHHASVLGLHEALREVPHPVQRRRVPVSVPRAMPSSAARFSNVTAGPCTP
jgi:hypothetical protein